MVNAVGGSTRHAKKQNLQARFSKNVADSCIERMVWLNMRFKVRNRDQLIL